MPAADARRRAGVALCLASAVGFGLMAIIAKEAYRAGLGVSALLAARFVLAAAILWLIVAARGRARPSRRTVIAGLALGAIGYSAQAGLFFSSLTRIDASLASLLLYAYPALVYCGAIALGRERVTALKACALALASAGVALVLLGGAGAALEPIGALLALGAGALYASYILLTDAFVGRRDPFVLGALIASGAAVTFTLTGAVGGTLAFPAGGWIWIVAIALASTVAPIVTFMLGLQRVGASTASILSTVEPVVTVGLAVALLGEQLAPAQLAGGALVVSAVVALHVGGERAHRAHRARLAVEPG